MTTGRASHRRAGALASTLALLATPGAAHAGAPPDPVVRIDSGSLRGVTRSGVDLFLGIPYAAPPLGALRWKPPQAVQAWAAVRDATAFGNTCAQSGGGSFADPSPHEDCLYLNVYAPVARKPGEAGRPVLVWIHGGGLSGGASNDYDGSRLAAQGGAVVVTINYRLGSLGFLAHPALDKEGHPFANYGLLDQQFALRWVKRNIAAFGGDPGNVTLAGQSSGATSVMSHVVSPGAADLFQHAISQSGGAVILRLPAYGAPRPLENAQEMGRRFAEAAGCADQRAECLRKLPVDRILAAQRAFRINQGIIDGTILPTSYEEAFRSGRINRVTLISGSNHDEWRWAVGGEENRTGKAMTAAEYPARIEAYYGKDLTPRVLERYPLSAYLSPSLAYSAAITDSMFACTGRRMNQWVAQHTPTYAFEFADQTAPSHLQPTSFPVAAGHTYEIQYLFPLYRGASGVAHSLNPLQEKLAAKMVEYWTSTAGANAGKLWPKYDPGQDNYLRLVLPEPQMTSGTFAADHHCAFWDQAGQYG